MATLVSLTDYKAWLNISGTSLDSVLTRILESTSAEIRRWCDRDETNGFESAARTEQYNGTDENTIQLKEYPVTSIASVSILYAGGTTDVLDSSTYRIDSKSGILGRIDASRRRFATIYSNYQSYSGEWLPSPRFPFGFNNIEVVYTAGYATIPKDLQMACIRLSDMAYANRGRDPLTTNETIGQYSYTRGNASEVFEIRRTLCQMFQNGNL